MTLTPSRLLTVLTLLLATHVAAQATPPTQVVQPAPVTTELTLTITAQGPITTLTVTQALPAGAAYQPGSSRWNGSPLPDPTLTPQGLTWNVISTSSRPDDLTFTVTLPGGARLPAPTVTAAPGDTRPAPTTPTSIQHPQEGALIHVRDAITVTVTDPGTDLVPLTVNGAPIPATLIGEEAAEPNGPVRRTYVGVPLQPGVNVIEHGTDRVTVRRVGPTTALQLQPITLHADGRTPLTLEVRAVDADGQPTTLDTVTITGPTPLDPDADPDQPGHQVHLVHGAARLTYPPTRTPTPLTVTVTHANLRERTTFPLTVPTGTVAIALLSVTLGLDGTLSRDNLTWQGRASLDTELSGGRLTAAADRDGLPTDPDPLQRFTSTGDASASTAPLQGDDPVAFTYDHPDFQVQYRRAPLPITALPTGAPLTALSGTLRRNPDLSAFIALVPTDQISRELLTPDGTRLLRLQQHPITPGSDTLTLVTTDRVTGQERTRTPLQRGADYQLDVTSGLITLTQPLARYDTELGEQHVEASYRLQQPLGERRPAYGVQSTYRTDHATFAVAALHLDGHTTFGARATYQGDHTLADALIATSSGLLIQATYATQGPTRAAASVRYQDASYAGAGRATPGLTATATGTIPLTPTLDATLDATYTQNTTTNQGHVDARLTYHDQTLRLGAGVRSSFGDQRGLSATATAGYQRGPVRIDLNHTQPLTGTVPLDTALSARYRLTADTSLTLTSRTNWHGSGATILSLDSRVAGIDVTAAYELPTASGSGNLARFGVHTTLPLNDRTTLGLFASATTTPGAALSANLHYRADQVTATLGTDLTLSPTGPGLVVRSGVSGSVTDQLTLSADTLLERTPERTGVRFAAGYAYRTPTLDSLGTVRYAQGSLADQHPELSSVLAATYHQPTWAVRAGVDTRTLLNDPGSFTLQGHASGTTYLTDRFGLGLALHAITQPSTQTTRTGIGLEGTYRALPGTWITAGYNLTGFDGVSSTYTRPGLYLRLDLTADDTLGDPK